MPSAEGNSVLDNSYMTNPSVAIWVAGSLLIQVVVQEAAQPRDRGSETPVSLCGISFKVPADWVTERSAPRISEICLGEIMHKRYEMLVGDGPSHFWRIAVEVMPWTFESVMERYDVRREGGRWFDDLPQSVESGAVWVIISNTASERTATFLVGEGADTEVLPLLLKTVSFDQKR